MRVLLDTNIVLDVLSDRPPFNEPAKAVWTKVTAGELEASLVATSLTNIFYILRKTLGTDVALEKIGELLSIFEVCPVDGSVLQAALTRPMRDFEDAVQDAAAEFAGITIIVTRNPSDFVGSGRRILDAAALVEELDRPHANQGSENPPEM